MSERQWPQPPAIPQGKDKLDDAPLKLYESLLEAHVEEVKTDLLRQLEDHKAALARETAAQKAEIDTNAAEQSAAITRQAAIQAAEIAAKAAAQAASISAEAASRADRVAIKTAQTTSDTATAASELAFYQTVLTEIFKGYVEVAKGATERSFARSQRVETAAVAVGTLYTGILAYLAATAPSAAGVKEGFEVLESRAMIPTVFLAAAIVFSVAYVSVLAPQRKGRAISGDPLNRQDLINERNNFANWTIKVPRWRIVISQLAVISLGLGVASLPIGFVDMSNTAAALVFIGMALIFLALLAGYWKSQPQDNLEQDKETALGPRPVNAGQSK